MNALTQYLNLYAEHRHEICAYAPELLNAAREGAYSRIADAQLPERGQETYDVTSVNEMFAPDYGVNINRVNFPIDTAATFKCGVPNISTLMVLVANDIYAPTATLVRNLPVGVTVTSLAKAAKETPELVSQYLNALVPDDNVAAQLNTLLLQDGVFIHVKRNVHLSKPIQIVNIFNAVAPVMGVRRIIVALEDEASASVLVCDHSQRHEMAYLSNQVVELFVGKGASLEYYDLEESSESTSRLSQLFASQKADSKLLVNGSTLIGGKSRNNYSVKIEGDHADTQLVGMAIASDAQIVDNTTYISHASKDSKSTQMFKYVLDGAALGNFYGTIVVDECAKHTNAYQTNRNILASKEAKMYTRPQLEIYCDDVKCSHGATVGQLDANALFYMRSRGIPLAQARLMLMQAFMADVVDTVSISALKTRLQQLVESRLCGQRTLCADCSVNS